MIFYKNLLCGGCSSLEAVAWSPSPAVISAFSNAAATVSILEGLGSPEIDEALQKIEASLSPQKFAELQGLREKLSGALQDAKTAIGFSVTVSLISTAR